VGRKESLIFHPEFRHSFELSGKKFLIAGLTPADRTQIQAGLRDMSQESIRNRFLGSKKEFTEKELDYLTSLDGINHYALGVEEADAPHRGVAVIRMVRSEKDHTEAEVGITIIDQYQKMGLGSFLLDLLILAAEERGISKLSFTFLPANEAIVKLIRKKGAPSLLRAYGSVRMFLRLNDVRNDELKDRVRLILPEIDSDQKKT
jgi:RimJ/RimL family protein N-acetyltransferase